MVQWLRLQDFIAGGTGLIQKKKKKKKKKFNNQTKLYLGRMNNIILGHEQEYFPLSATWEQLT